MILPTIRVRPADRVAAWVGFANCEGVQDRNGEVLASLAGHGGVGSLAPTVPGYIPGQGGSIAAISGPIVINSASSGGTLIVDDSGDSTRSTWTLNRTSVSALAAAIHLGAGQLSALTEYGGSGGDTFNLQGTSSVTTATIDTGTGNDVVNVQSAAGPLILANAGGQDTDTLGSKAPSLGGTLQIITGPVTVTNAVGSGSIALILDDSADRTNRTITVTNNQVTGLPTPIS
jgi:hypothetical protein